MDETFQLSPDSTASQREELVKRLLSKGYSAEEISHGSYEELQQLEAGDIPEEEEEDTSNAS